LGWRFNGVSVGASFGFGLGINAFAFVSFGDFCNHDLGHRRFGPERVTTIYNQTTIINNYQVHNNTIVHGGIPIERVSAASHVPVPRATVRDLPAGSNRMASHTGAVVYRPQLQAPARPVKMVAQQVDTRHPIIQHAPIAPVRTTQASTYSRGGSAPVATPRQPAMAAPKTSTWSSGAKTSASPQYQSAPRASESTHAAPSASTSTWSSEQRKSGASSAPGNWSETSSPGGNKSPSPAQSATSAKQAPAVERNSHVYQPKGYYQAPETRSRSSSDSGRSATPASSEKSPESHSKKN
jgi:hypothetical protein